MYPPVYVTHCDRRVGDDEVFDFIHLSQVGGNLKQCSLRRLEAFRLMDD